MELALKPGCLRALVVAALALALTAPAAAQVAGSVAVADSAAADSAASALPEAPAPPPEEASAADTARALVSAYAPPPGVVFGPVPATQPGLTVHAFLADAPGAFRYDLGSPGWPDGLSFDGTAPHRAALALDGVPYDDLATGRPRYDLLPLDLLGRLALEPRALGAPAATHAALRPLDAPVARTELRYLTGQEGVQFIGATHAQTRRPGFVGRNGRLGVLFHVAGRSADGFYDGSDLGSSRVVGRVALHRPGFGLAVTDQRTRQQLGARGAVTGAIYDPLNATIPEAAAERTDVHHVTTVRLRWATGLLPEPLTATAFRVAQTARYTAGGASDDPAEVEARRWGAALAQPLALGRHGLALRLHAWRDAALDSTSAALLPAAGARTFVHAAVADTVTLAGTALRLQVGLDRTPEGTAPGAYLVATRRLGPLRLDATAQYGGVRYGRAEVGGYAPDGVPALDVADAPGEAPPALGGERYTQVAVGLRLDVGALRLGLRAAGVAHHEPRLLLADAVGGAGAAFTSVPGSVQRVLVTASLAFRPDAARGVYAGVQATGHAGAYRGESDLAQASADRFLAALPDAWGQAHLGVRALGVFDGVLDLDLALRARAWTAFASRTFHGPTGLLPLAAPEAAEAPAGGTLDVVLLARLQERASVFLVYENALAERAYAGTYLVPVYPLPPHHLRFGVFWTLFG